MSKEYACKKVYLVNDQNIQVDDAIVNGNGNKIKGNRNLIQGNDLEIDGDENSILGERIVVSGKRNMHCGLVSHIFSTDMILWLESRRSSSVHDDGSPEKEWEKSQQARHTNDPKKHTVKKKEHPDIP